MLTIAQDESLIAKIDIPSLLLEASSLRSGHTCTAPSEPLKPTGTSLVGQGSNFHLPLTFDDEVKWMVRMKRRTWDGPSPEVLLLTARSEVATLRTLKERGLAVPGAWQPAYSTFK